MATDLLSTIRTEIDARLTGLRPLLAEYERLLKAADALVENGNATRSPAVPRVPREARTRRATRGSAAGVIARAAEGTASEARGAKPSAEKQAHPRRDAASEAILAALDHGSHTASELVMVTAMSAPSVNASLRRLVTEAAIAKTEREGKTAYVLSVTP